MLWYKSWLETRARFGIGLGILVLSACGTVFAYPSIAELTPMLSPPQGSDSSGGLAAELKEAIALGRTYRGYVWSQSFSANLLQLTMLFAVLLGAGGALAQSAGRGTLFALSLPVTRSRLLAIRTATGLAELFALAFIPAIALALLSPAVGQSYSVIDALVHGLCLFGAGAVFFSLAALLSTYFGDFWRPLLVSCLIAILLALTGAALKRTGWHGIFALMSGEAWFRAGTVPWLGLLASVLVCSGMLYAAARNLARRDF